MTKCIAFTEDKTLCQNEATVSHVIEMSKGATMTLDYCALHAEEHKYPDCKVVEIKKGK